MKNIVILLFVFTIFSCQEKIVDKDTKIFSHYLKETFDWKIKNEPHAYILTNYVVCKGCVNRVIPQLVDLLPKDSENYTIITTQPKIFPESIRNRSYFYEDTTLLLNKINLNIDNVTVIHTKNKKVEKIDRIKTEDLEDDIAHFFKIIE